MNSVVIGMTGWWSGLIAPLRKPVELVLEEVEKRSPLTKCHQGTWHAAEEFSKLIPYSLYDRIVVLGHSYGASAATHLMHMRKDITFDLFISMDQGLDSLFIVDKPIGSNCLRVDEWHVAYEGLTYAPGWSGEHNFYEHGGVGAMLRHTSFFTQEHIVEQMVERVLEVIR